MTAITYKQLTDEGITHAQMTEATGYKQPGVWKFQGIGKKHQPALRALLNRSTPITGVFFPENQIESNNSGVTEVTASNNAACNGNPEKK